MDISAESVSLTGGRKVNEDMVLVRRQADNMVAVVADGLGGHGSGGIAARIAAETIADGFAQKSSLIADDIQALFYEANERIIAQQQHDCKMKSTAAALFICDNAAVCAHLGDSRIYHFTEEGLVFQTEDHSVSQMAVYAGKIKQEDVRHHIDRNKIFRALGTDEGMLAEISRINLSSGENAFLLCTDGFWEHVLETEMELDLRKSSNSQQWMNCLLDRIKPRMNAPDALRDNLSAITVLLYA